VHNNGKKNKAKEAKEERMNRDKNKLASLINWRLLKT